MPDPESGLPSPAALREKFDLFLFELDDALMRLRAQVAAFDLPELLPLDGTPESLDRLERAYDLVLDGDVRSGDLDVFATRVARYLGEALRRDVGGHWRLCTERRNVAYGLPWITELPNLRGFGWSSTTATVAVVVCFAARSSPSWPRQGRPRVDVAAA